MNEAKKSSLDAEATKETVLEAKEPKKSKLEVAESKRASSRLDVALAAAAEGEEPGDQRLERPDANKRRHLEASRCGRGGVGSGRGIG